MNTFFSKPFVVSFIFTNIIIFICPSNISASAVEERKTGETLFAVIFDAGSTGSRVIAYKFIRDSSGSLHATEQLLFESNKTGLSTFIDEPQKGVDSIRILLEKAKQCIDKSFWPKTHLSLKATAGLRKVGAAKSDLMLKKLTELFSASGFLTTKKSAEIMNGKDEGFFSWLTVNIIFNRLNSSRDNTNAVLDLGGASIEVTYETNVRNYPDDCYRSYEVAGKRIPFYSKSFNTGLYSGREGTFTATLNDKTNVTSPCIHTKAKKVQFNFGPNTYNVTGVTNGQGINYNECKEKIESYVKSQSINKIRDLSGNNNIVAISFFFAVANGDVKNEVAKDQCVQIKSYYNAAEKECAKAYSIESDPFKCMDLLYIAVLLDKGFGLSLNTTIHLMKSFNNFEISWALGFAYHFLQYGDRDVDQDNISFTNIPL